MRRALRVALVFMFGGCAPALVNYRGVEYGVSERDAICAEAFNVRTDDKVADQGDKKWPPVESWLRRAKLHVTPNGEPSGVAIDFSSHPQIGCTHCDWPPDDRWNALLYTAGNTSSYFQLEGANRPGADAGRAFVDALVQLRRRAGCLPG